MRLRVLVASNFTEPNARQVVTKPGVDLRRHYHLGHTFVYVLEGALVIQEPGKPAATYGPGQAFHEPPNVAHDARSASATAQLKILVSGGRKRVRLLAVPVK